MSGLEAGAGAGLGIATETVQEEKELGSSEKGFRPRPMSGDEGWSWMLVAPLPSSDSVGRTSTYIWPFHSSLGQRLSKSQEFDDAHAPCSLYRTDRMNREGFPWTERQPNKDGATFLFSTEAECTRAGRETRHVPHPSPNFKPSCSWHASTSGAPHPHLLPLPPLHPSSLLFRVASATASAFASASASASAISIRIRIAIGSLTESNASISAHSLVLGRGPESSG